MSIQNEKKVLFDPQTRVAPLGLIAFLPHRLGK